ncbi:hypothetical protein EZS27_003603 [termite gut metagenome]|uniref:Uncharacterized protein n=1 Tax=termite gut metagenome TaxID=433724 RepID=A0A5J4SUN3_9ZZZZ
MFETILASVLNFFGIPAFAKNTEGKSTLTEEQKTQLTEKWGAKFVTEFEKDLIAYETDGKKADGEETQAAMKQLEQDKAKLAKELKTAQDKLVALETEEKKLKTTIAKLEGEETPDAGKKIEGEKKDMKKDFKPDMTLAHNQYLHYIASGKPGAAYSGDTTVDTQELRTEFGKYVSSEKIEIIKGLISQTESVKYMSTIKTDKTEVRAQQAAINSVLQQFTPFWTPKGKSKFTPLKIKNFKCKINVPIVPSDIMEDILGYLYDENLKPEDMPVVKYILYQLVFPKLDEERETALAVGEFVESQASEDGDEATPANATLDGYLTQLKKLKEAGNEKITWLLDEEPLNDATLIEQIDKAVDQVAPLYKKKTMFIHADPDIVARYSKAYRKKYPWLKNEDGEKIKVDFSRFTFAPLEGMRGTGAFFITPQENFKHLISKDPQSTKVWMQGENYAVKIFAEWWEAVGFWLAEAIFAYLPPTEESQEESQDEGI